MHDAIGVTSGLHRVQIARLAGKGGQRIAVGSAKISYTDSVRTSLGFDDFFGCWLGLPSIF